MTTQLHFDFNKQKGVLVFFTLFLFTGLAGALYFSLQPLQPVKLVGLFGFVAGLSGVLLFLSSAFFQVREISWKQRGWGDRAAVLVSVTLLTLFFGAMGFAGLHDFLF